MEYIKKYKITLLIALIIFVVIIISFVVKPKKVESIEIVQSETLEKEKVKNTIKFEIKGAIKENGVYELEENSRIIDAINISGGLLKNADIDKLNLSAKLMDAMVIEIPYQEVVENRSIKVDIKGAVINSGVYELKEDSRIIDVIIKSGGLKEEADTSSINLSKKVFDEMVIIIPKKEQVNEEIKNDAIIGDEQNKENEIDSEIKENDGIKTEDKEPNKISLNNATKEQLMTLPSIGESKALAIIEYRQNKKFDNIEQIKEVSGIGNSLYEKIKEYIIP